MDHPNENMENFFRKSLDKFDEEPSGDVWAALDERLEEERPLFLYKWIKFLIPVALLLIGFSALYYNQSRLLNDYKLHLSELTKENDQLKQENKYKTESERSLISTADNTNIETAPQIIEKYIDRVKVLRDTVYLTKYISSTLSDIESGSFGHNEISQANTSGDYSLKNNLLEGSLNNTENQDSKNSRPRISDFTSLPFRSVDDNILVGSLTGKESTPLMKLTRSKPNFRNRKKKKIPNSPVIVKNLEPWGQPGFYYKIGPSLKVTSTLKGELFSPSSIGLSYGISQEIGLTSRFAFTVGAMRSFQEYRLSNNGLPLDNITISSYPDREMFDSQIKSIEVENHFYEFPIGVKYDFYQDNLKSFYVNPAVKWSVLKPQDMRYDLIDNRVHLYDGHTTYGYLNSLSLAVGVEKNISRWLSYQMSLAYDHGIEPVGVELQHQNSVHFNINLLFGKK